MRIVGDVVRHGGERIVLRGLGPDPRRRLPPPRGGADDGAGPGPSRGDLCALRHAGRRRLRFAYAQGGAVPGASAAARRLRKRLSGRALRAGRRPVSGATIRDARATAGTARLGVDGVQRVVRGPDRRGADRAGRRRRLVGEGSDRPRDLVGGGGAAAPAADPRRGPPPALLGRLRRDRRVQRPDDRAHARSVAGRGPARSSPACPRSRSRGRRASAAACGSIPTGTIRCTPRRFGRGGSNGHPSKR
jgi:hypothetical protein